MITLDDQITHNGNQCDRVGECDACSELKALWLDLESAGCGDWHICRPCWRNIIDNRRRSREGGAK